MIEIMTDLPPHVTGFKAIGKVTKQDYENVLIPAVDKQAKLFTKLNFILLLDTDVSNFTLGAWKDDLWVGLKHISHWHKVAIVSNKDSIKKITDIFGHLVPGEYKGFMTVDLGAAKEWVAT